MLIDWREIDKEIVKVYKRGHSVVIIFFTSLTLNLSPLTLISPPPSAQTFGSA